MIAKLKITVLIENQSSREELRAEHGLSLWVEADNRRLLFDTGQSAAFVENARTLGVNLADAEAVVLSHGHYDHGGGLAASPERFRHARLYVHPAAFDAKYVVPPGQAGRCNTAEFGGLDAIRSAIPNTILTEGPTEIMPNIYVTGAIPRRREYEDTGGPFFRDAAGTTPDPLSDDQAVYIATTNGLVVLLGCAHAGTVNTLDYVAELTSRQHVHAVLGGMHLCHSSEKRVRNTLAALQEYDPRWIGPCHCTGPDAVERIRAEFPDCFLAPASGAVFEF